MLGNGLLGPRRRSATGPALNLVETDDWLTTLEASPVVVGDRPTHEETLAALDAVREEPPTRRG